jgi:hypothetical protein
MPDPQRQDAESVALCPGSGSTGVRLRDPCIRCPYCKQYLMRIYFGRNLVPNHPALTDGLEAQGG